jgi:hypothetical protein
MKVRHFFSLLIPNAVITFRAMFLNTNTIQNHALYYPSVTGYLENEQQLKSERTDLQDRDDMQYESTNHSYF